MQNIIIIFCISQIIINLKLYKKYSGNVCYKNNIHYSVNYNSLIITMQLESIVDLVNKLHKNITQKLHYAFAILHDNLTW